MNTIPVNVTLRERLRERNNSLNILRLMLASLVIVGHAWPLTGSNTEPRLEFISHVAVDAFFVISGYLVSASRVSANLLVYTWRRILRIFPGLVVCLTITAGVAAPLAAWVAGTSLSWPSALNYVAKGSLLLNRQWGIDGTLTAVPYPNAWNGSLWTLQFEFLAYVMLAALLTLPWVRRHSTFAIPALSIVAIISWAMAPGLLNIHTNFYLSALRLGSYFLTGVAFFFLSPHIRIRPVVSAASALILIGLSFLGIAGNIGQIPLAYLLLQIGSLSTSSPFTKTDVSYGVYIYAWPIQQLLALCGSASWGVIVNSLLTLVLTLPIAWLSWTFVEKPMLRFKEVMGARKKSGGVELVTTAPQSTLASGAEPRA
ncbi:acyltransferase [Sinomonas flava]|uniref:Acyltransferase n=1 Tax=Sinomonas flava TaxID=496857 RepID=A0ABN3BP10_9MICC